MTTRDDDPTLLAHAYLDGELDPAHALEIERRFDTDPALAAERDRVAALRGLIDKLPRERAPEGLIRRVEATAGLRRERPSWRMLAAAVLLAAIVASSATWLALRGGAIGATPGMVVASHMRALMAPQPFDIASSDRHTVKPWFNGRIPQAPTVVDLAGEGFPLAGGRIDVIGPVPVPTLVYRHSQHVISLVEIPGGAETPTRETIQGFNVLSWSDGGVVYWAVSDVGIADLDAFAKAFQNAAKEG